MIGILIVVAITVLVSWGAYEVRQREARFLAAQQARRRTNDSLTTNKPIGVSLARPQTSRDLALRDGLIPYGPPKPKVPYSVYVKELTDWLASRSDDPEWPAFVDDLLEAMERTFRATFAERSEFLGDWPKLRQGWLDEDGEEERAELAYDRMLEIAAKWEGHPLGSSVEAVKLTVQEKSMRISMDLQGFTAEYWADWYEKVDKPRPDGLH